MKYTTERGEYNGRPTLEFRSKANTSKWPELTMGLKKCKVVKAILDDEGLAAELIQFVEDHEPVLADTNKEK